MSLLNKLVIIITLSIQVSAITTSETPLFQPDQPARSVGLSKASFGDADFNNMIINPASIVGNKGFSIHSNELLGINYSSIIFANEYNDIDFGVHYIGSSITDISRAYVDGTTVIELDTFVPYEYHGLTAAIAKKFNNISLGFGLRYKTLILDNYYTQSTEGSMGIGIDLFKQFKFNFSIQNHTLFREIENSLQFKEPIYSTSLNYYVTKYTTFFLAFINNKNELSSHSTVHYSMEHYIGKYIPLRIGLDHNRHTFGTGILLDPFEIDIGWAQSRDSEVSDQVTIGFSYGFEEKNHLY